MAQKKAPLRVDLLRIYVYAPRYREIKKCQNGMGMMMSKIEETNSIDLRFIEAMDEKSGKEEIEELLRSERVEDIVEKLLDEMLKFLAEMPIDGHHDFRTFRHGGLRGYLINRFLRERA
jgi:hypothetical protein